jgi:hypothetical protein
VEEIVKNLSMNSVSSLSFWGASPRKRISKDARELFVAQQVKDAPGNSSVDKLLLA